MSKTTEVELTDKERAVTWAVMAWFNKNRVGTSRLMGKLYFDEAHSIAKKYDERIEDIIIEVGEWLKKRRAEVASKEKGSSDE